MTILEMFGMFILYALAAAFVPAFLVGVGILLTGMLSRVLDWMGRHE